MSFLRQGFRKFSHRRLHTGMQTDRRQQNHEPSLRVFAGGQKRLEK